MSGEKHRKQALGLCSCSIKNQIIVLLAHLHVSGEICTIGTWLLVSFGHKRKAGLPKKAKWIK